MTLLWRLVGMILVVPLIMGPWVSPSSLLFVHGAHSRLSYVVRRREREPQFDQSIATFNKEGRLLQVEYGSTASEKGSPAVVVSGRGDDTLIVAKSKEQVFQLDRDVLMVASGLLGDAQWLAGILRQYCQKFRSQYQEPPTLQDVAQYAADLGHLLTRQGGLRPLGCAVILVSTTAKENPIQIGQAGAVETDRSLLAIGKGREDIVKALSDTLASRKWNKGKHEDGTQNSAVLKATVQSMNLKDEETVVLWKIHPSSDGASNSKKSLITCLVNVDKQSCQ
ncbi:alpha type-7-1 [Seminavis robusta]|uniref:Alpha type-7-1 n=1 Tax=Seminavis robusta TaxID=568900 RepID=A0A9N8D8G1_9STRA|nr:alpha type-7-1 [Seminavis robusta]|eukprot:Sro1_g000600.1 alpha type-7-1 (280) ;mRNA; f:171624-172463